ncbi:hypothetical protein Vretifemale_16942 [Volvox reticuliferus]|nr:hypothetical protein Vretifemale_16942 [Volvox reticuliferus]
MSASNSSGPPDWVALVEAADPGPFLQSVQVQLQSPQSHFKSVQQSLSSVFFNKVDSSRSLDFLLCCLEVLVLGADARQPIPASSTRSVSASCASSNMTSADAGPGSATAAVAVAAAPTALTVLIPGNVAPTATAAVTVSSSSQGCTPEVLHGFNGQQQQPQQGQQQQQQQRVEQARPAKDAGGLSGTVSHLLLELLQQQQQLNRASKRQQQQQQQQGQHEQLQQQQGGQVVAAAAMHEQQDLAALLPAHRTRVLRLFAACCSQPRHARHSGTGPGDSLSGAAGRPGGPTRAVRSVAGGGQGGGRGEVGGRTEQRGSGGVRGGVHRGGSPESGCTSHPHVRTEGGVPRHRGPLPPRGALQAGFETRLGGGGHLRRERRRHADGTPPTDGGGG